MDKSLILNSIKSFLNIKTDSDFAAFLGIRQNTLSSWRSRNSIDYDLIIAKCDFIDANWLLTGKGEMLRSETKTPMLEEPDVPYNSRSRKFIPLVSTEAIGGLLNSHFSIEEKDIQAQYVVPDFNGIDFMIRVKGSSMYPKYNSGDIVACRILKERHFIQWNKIHVIATGEQGILIKRLKKGTTEGSILAISDNKEYDPFEIPKEDIHSIALVIGVIRLE